MADVRPDLALRPRSSCRFDAVSLGEIMLRLDPGEHRIRTARHFDVYEGGGEYNVTRGLSRVFGLRTAVVTALARNEIGHLIEGLVLAGGLSTEWIRWVEYDGVGKSVRNGLNFTERGFGARPPLGVSDRGHSAASQLRPEHVDWDRLLGEQGVRWLHTGGIYAGLSDTSAATVLAAAKAAREHGTVVSYDLNYRPSIWRASGGEVRARAVNAEIAPYVDVMIGDVDHLAVLLGVETSAAPGPHRSDEARLTATAERLADLLPRLRMIAATRRTVHSASSHGWGAVGWSTSGGAVSARTREHVEIWDRVGGGDAFAAGLIYGLLADEGLPAALEYGAAHGLLAMTTPGDNSMTTKEEVAALAFGGGSRFDR